VTTGADHLSLSPDERERLRPYVTDLDGPVFALTNLPEVVKGALFARYSRSPKSLRRLLLDEFLPDGPAAAMPSGHTGQEHADALYGRVLSDYGDDSVAQLGAAHIAVEGASNVLTKVLEWGRMASYLEQSTRYISFADRVGGRFRYHRPEQITADPDLGPRYTAVLDEAFTAYGELIPVMIEHVDAHMGHESGAPPAARERAVRARALDLLRGLLPAATTANVGIFASGQAFEAMLVRMGAHPLPEARECAARMLVELRKVIPAFLARVDRHDRGTAQGHYLARLDETAAEIAQGVSPPFRRDPPGASVRLIEFDPDAELRVLAQAVWPFTGGRLAEARAWVGGLSHEERARHLREWAGERRDRRWRPGRALESTTYTFEIVCDYGAYRDLQRHRLLTLLAQPLGPDLGYEVPSEVARAGAGDRYAQVQDACADLARAIGHRSPIHVPYAVTLAHRIRFVMTMNAREAMHLIELRSQPQGHESYRWVAREMHRLIDVVAGHRAIAAMMDHVDVGDGSTGRLAAESRNEARRAGGA
jgi:thymidylate synthase ThyX